MSLGGSSNSLSGSLFIEYETPATLNDTWEDVSGSALGQRKIHYRYQCEPAGLQVKREIGEHPGVGLPIGVCTNYIVEANGCVEHLVQLYVPTIGLHKAGSRHAQLLRPGFGLLDVVSYVVDTRDPYARLREFDRVPSSAAAEIKHGVAGFDAAVLDDFLALLDRMSCPAVIVIQRHPCVRLLGDLIRRLQALIEPIQVPSREDLLQPTKCKIHRVQRKHHAGNSCGWQSDWQTNLLMPQQP